MTKRIGNLWDKFVSMDNLRDAYKNARKGRGHRSDVMAIDEDPEKYLQELQKMLMNGEYHSSTYRIFSIHERGKDREVADLPFYPDRIVHWALINVLRPMLMTNLVPQTYAALPGRGAHQALTKLKSYLKEPDAKYYLKLDIRKFFPSIDKEVMMAKLSDRIKDKRILDLCKLIIDEYPGTGLPIGNYTSQYFANFYLSDLDHFMKEEYHCKYYLRYMDDIVIIGWSKQWLHRCLKRIERMVGEWGLTVKKNWCIRPVKCGIDFVGYVTYPRFCLIRKKTKIRLKRACRRATGNLRELGGYTDHDRGAIASYKGCLDWCDGFRLSMASHLRQIYDAMHAIS